MLLRLRPRPRPPSSPAAIASPLLYRRSLPSLPNSSPLPLIHLPASIRRYAVPAASAEPAAPDLHHTRNIGIIAHIDAGKTTTTERMLYYSGFTRRIGEVDEGSTIMDYLPAERARGITITSAAITFPWTPSSTSTSPPTPYTVNLIDTPGHADFTFEVSRSLRVLDGAVTILDGVAGVEAQTEKVWRQAHAHALPRIIFVNKLDRTGARFGATVREIGLKLKGYPAVLQLPVYEPDTSGTGAGEDVLRGVVDVLERRVFLYQPGGDGRRIDVKDYEWLQSTRPELHAEALAARAALVELLSERDEDLINLFLELGDGELIPASALHASLRKQVLPGNGRIIPVLCGASFRNIGVQPLLDAVTAYLPSPLDRPRTQVSIAGQRALLDVHPDRVCALAFKVVHDAKRGAMVFVRVYSGTLARGQMLHNTSLGVKERAMRLLQMYADEAVDITSLSAGHIGVILGLKHARTGDTLVSEPPPQKHNTHHHKHKTHPPPKSKDALTLQLAPIPTPPPVFFAALEPHSLSAQKQLADSLALLLREDPSLHVSVDEDSGQTLLSGMGELHLEIARDRLVGDLKAQATMGRILIAYRETPLQESAEVRKVFEREIAGKMGKAACTAVVAPLDPVSSLSSSPSSPPPDEGEDVNSHARHCHRDETDHHHADGNSLHLTVLLPPAHPHPHHPPPPPPLPPPQIRAALLTGALAALGRGPALGLPVRGADVRVTVDPAHDLEQGSGGVSSPAAIASAARLAVAAALKDAGGAAMEPVMSVAIDVNEGDLGRVVADLTGARGGHVLGLDDAALEAGVETSSSSASVGGGNPGVGGKQEGKEGVGEGGEEAGEFEIDPAKLWVPATGDVDPGTRGGSEKGAGRGRVVRARVPLKEMVGYLRHLRSLTGGRGGFVMTVEGWEKMVGPRREEVERELKLGF